MVYFVDGRQCLLAGRRDKMKFKSICAVVCCVALLAISSVTAYALPEDNSYIDDIYNWVSSTVSDIADSYTSSDGGTDTDSSDYYDDTSSDNTSHEDETEYYQENETYYEQTEQQEDSDSSEESSHWYDWFSVSQVETEPETETLPPQDTEQSSSGTTEYVGYGLFMWAVIVVGVLLTLGILTNTHIRKKS